MLRYMNESSILNCKECDVAYIEYEVEFSLIILNECCHVINHGRKCFLFWLIMTGMLHETTLHLLYIW